MTARSNVIYAATMACVLAGCANDGSLSTEKPSANGGSTSYSYPDKEWLNGVVARGPNGMDPVRRVLTLKTSMPRCSSHASNGPRTAPATWS